MNIKHLTSLLTMALITAFCAPAADFYWIAATGENWSEAANWSDQSGGPGGFGVPSTSDQVYFDGNGSGNCTIDVAIHIDGMELMSGFSGSLIQQSTIEIKESGWTLNEGTFLGGTDWIKVHGTLEVNTNASFTSTDAALSVYKNLTLKGTFDANEGTVELYSNSSSNNEYVVIANNQAFKHLTIADDYSSAVIGSMTIPSGQSFTVVGDLKFTGTGACAINGGTIYAKGNLIQEATSSAFGGGNTNIVINGVSNQTVTGSSSSSEGAFVKLTINKTMGTLFLNGVINATGGIEYVQGTVDANTYNSLVNFRSVGIAYNILGNLTLNDVSFEANQTFNNFYIGSDTLFVKGDLTLFGSESLHLKTGAIVLEGDLLLQNTNATGDGNLEIIFAGSADQQINSSVIENRCKLPHVTILKNGGVLYASGNISLKGNLRQRRGTFFPGSGDAHWYFKGNTSGQEIDLLDSDYGFGDVNIEPESGTVDLANDLRINGTLTIADRKTLHLNGHRLLLEGDFINNGTLTNTDGKVIFCGEDLQTIGGTKTTSFPDFELKSNDEVKLLRSASVAGIAAFTGGKLDLNGYTFEMVNSGQNTLRSGYGSLKKASSGEVKINSEDANVYSIPYRGTASATWGYEYLELRFQTDLSEPQDYELHVNTDNDLYIAVNTAALAGSQTIRIDIITNSGLDLPLFVPVDAAGRFADLVYADVLDGNEYGLTFTDLGGGIVVIDDIGQYFDDFILRSPFPVRNWVSETRYDTDGNIISSSKRYIDGLGRTDQVQVENLETGDVLASEVIFDALGRPALYTLPAVSGSLLSYNSNLLKDAGNSSYDYNDFDLPATRNNPAAAGTASNTVGKYYSATGEEHIDETSFPFTRVRYTADPRSQGMAQSQPTEVFKPGAGKESWAFSMPIYDELDLVLGNNKSYKVEVNASNKLQSSALAISGAVSGAKQVSRMPSGEEVVNYYGADGSAIASCRSGLSSSCSTQAATNLLRMEGTRSVDLHLPYANIASLELPNLTYGTGATAADVAEYDYVLYDLKNDELLTEGSAADYTINSSTGAVTFVGAVANESIFLRVYLQLDADYQATIEAGGDAFNDVTIAYELDYSHWTINYYDLAGLTRKSVSPKDCSCDNSGTHVYYEAYDYNPYGQVVSESLPDEGENNYLYDVRGRLRFSQDASQADDEAFGFISYDEYGRIVKEGEYTTADDRLHFQDYYGVGSSSYTSTTSVHTILEDDDGVNNAHTTELKEFTYYTELSGNSIPVSTSMQALYEQQFTMGRIAKISANGERNTWYSYDQFGRIAFEVQEVIDASFGPLLDADDYFKATKFEYEPVLGRAEKVVYQDHETSERFQHLYSYNANGQLQSIEARKGAGTGTLVGEADYEYNTHFQLKRKELGGDLQGVDYVYRANGQLKALNHPSLTATDDPGGDGASGSTFYNDLFGYTIDYFKDDYTSGDNSIISSITSTAANHYQGLVAAVRYKINDTYAPDAELINKNGSTTTLISASTDECRFTYAYDDYFRLANAQFDVYHHTSATAASNSSTAFTDYKVFGDANTGADIEYDANGNILSLKRNGYSVSGSTLMDDLHYDIIPGTNKLNTIHDQETAPAGASGFPGSGTPATMTYDDSGRLRGSMAEDLQDISYHHSGMVKKILYINSDYIEYFYDHAGSVCRSLYHDYSASTTHTTWYINAGGRTQAIYEKETASSSLELTEYPVVGNARIGSYDTDQAATIYELKDHLGNVRVAFKQGSSTLEVVSWADYYPFGAVLPGRSYSAGAYRYGSGGEETAYTTGWTTYPLRMFNNLLGRFGAPDPYRQMHNAYQGMGNNPANFVDPSGGLFSGWGAWMSAEHDRQQDWNRAQVWGFIHDRELTKSGGAFGGGPVTVDGLQTSNSAGMLYYKNMSSQSLATMSSNAYDITLSDQWGNNFRGTSMEAATAKFANATPGYKVNHNPDGPTNAKPWKGMAEGHGLPIMNITADGPDNMNEIRAEVQAVLSGKTVKRLCKHGPGSSTWNMISDSGNGIGFLVGGASEKFARMLSKRLAWETSTPPYRSQSGPAKVGPMRVGPFSMSAATGVKIMKGLRLAGRVSGMLGVAMTLTEIGTGEKSFAGEGGLDLIMGGVAFIPGWGWAASGVYFGAKFVLTETGNDFWNTESSE